MAVSLKHQFTSAIPDSGDASLIQPSNWNAEHTLSLATGKLLGRSTAGTGAAEEITPSATLTLSGGNLGVATNPLTSAVGYTISGGGATITTGVAGPGIMVPYGCTINSVTMLADQTGSIVVDIWKDTYANYPPTVADSICASAKPTITTAIKSEDTTLTGWTTSIAAGDILRFNVDSVTSIQAVTIILKVTKT